MFNNLWNQQGKNKTEQSNKHTAGMRRDFVGGLVFAALIGDIF